MARHQPLLELFLGYCKAQFLDPFFHFADELNSTVRLFADDALMYCLIEGEVDSDSLQDDLHKLENWQDR